MSKKRDFVSTGDAEVDALIEAQGDETFEDETQVDLSAQVEATPAAAPESDAAVMAREMGKAIAGELRIGLQEVVQTINNSEHVRQIPYAKAIFNSPFNPTGSKNRPQLTRKTYQNFIQCDPNRMTDEEIQLANALVPGTYCNNAVTVREMNHNGSLVLDITYSNKSVEQRMDLMTNVGKNFAEICKTLIAEAAQQAKASPRKSA